MRTPLSAMSAMSAMYSANAITAKPVIETSRMASTGLSLSWKTNLTTSKIFLKFGMFFTPTKAAMSPFKQISATCSRRSATIKIKTNRKLLNEINVL